MVSRISGLFKRRQDEPDCVEVRGLSSDYIDGELDQADLDRVDAHLEWCAPCRSFFNALKSTVGLLGSFRRREIPPEVRQHIHEALRGEGEEQDR